jgi:hypothetical protein
VDLILQEAEEMLSHHVETVGVKNAGQIWAFMSKFVMLDRCGAALGAAQVHPGLPVSRKMCSPKYLGTGAKVTFLSLKICDSLTRPSDP